MTRPSTHRDITPDQSCGNCRFSACVRYKGDLLCFHGDDVTIRRDGPACWDACDIELRQPNHPSEDVALLEGEEYSTVWAGRIVDACLEVCDDWQPREVVA